MKNEKISLAFSSTGSKKGKITLSKKLFIAMKKGTFILKLNDGKLSMKSDKKSLLSHNLRTSIMKLIACTKTSCKLHTVIAIASASNNPKYIVTKKEDKKAG